MTTRRPRWHPPPPPSPKIIHLPRRLRRAKPAKTASKNGGVARRQGKLWSLFDQEREFAWGGVPVVVLSSSSDVSAVLGAGGQGRGSRTSGAGAVGGTEEEWRFQAEFLRAECHFLRTEREVALKKRERNRVQTEKAMKSAVQALTLGQSMISEGENAGLILEEAIQELEEKLEGLQRSPRGGGEARKCCNFDKKASALRRRMEKLDPTEEEHAEEKKCIREIRELAEASLGGHGTSEKVVSGKKSRLADVETIRRKMEGLSKGMLQRMEEYGGLLGGTATTTCVASSAAALVKTEFPETEVRPQPQEKRCGEDRGVCSGRCKSIVKKIVGQVRAETEQWTQLQAMLGQVREEMIELQASKDKWQRRAIESHSRLQTTKSDMQEWKQRAKRAETKAMELEKHISELQIEMMTVRKRRSNADKPVVDIETAWGLAKLDGSQKTLQRSHKEKEKRVLACRLKENLPPVHSGKRDKEEASDQPSRNPDGPGTPCRRPLGELGNNSQSPSIRNGRAAHPLLLF